MDAYIIILKHCIIRLYDIIMFYVKIGIWFTVLLSILTLFIFFLWRLGLIQILLKTPAWAWCVIGGFFLICVVVAGISSGYFAWASEERRRRIIRRVNARLEWLKQWNIEEGK